MNVRVDIWQLVEEDLFTDAPSWSAPIAWGQNTTEWVQGDGSLATPIKLDINWLVADPTPDDATDYVAIYDTSIWDHKKILLNQITSSHVVPVWPTVSVVAKNGDDATGEVGNAAKPFLTWEAADAATPLLGTIIGYPGDYTVNINTTLRRIILIDASLAWSINAGWLLVSWSWNSGVSSSFSSSISATITCNIFTADSLYSLTGQLDIQLSWFGHISNIHYWASPGDLMQDYGGSGPQGTPFAQNIWRIFCQWYIFNWTNQFNPGTVSKSIVKDVWEIYCAWFASGINGNNDILFEDIWYAECSSDVINWAPTSIDRTVVEFNNVRIKTVGGWRIVNWLWGTWPWMTLRVTWWSVIDCSAPENVIWAWSPAGKVAVMAPRSASRVSWDWGSGVVTDLLWDTLVNSAITLW